jgi:4-diphosphocytidyl-2-C-methyl-D-erythritol kinase
VVVFPNCKINLGLRIIRKRKDGFHDLDTVFYPLRYTDVLEIIRSEDDQVAFSCSGLSITGQETDNLCVKAYHLLKQDFPSLPAARLHLHKVIPTGAGLGGGSADAAFTLKLLNEKFQMGLSTGQLLDYALRLGSDCPFFIHNTPCYATGRGEILEPIGLDLSSFRIVVINPGIHIRTAVAFAAIRPAVAGRPAREIVQQPIESWKDELENDFEKDVFLLHPAIGKLKNALYEAGALYASMSGSGSTVYGIFRKEQGTRPAVPAHYLVKELPG